MIIRRFTGTNLEKVEEEIRLHLGADAQIISTRYLQKGLFARLLGRHYIEVIATLKSGVGKRKAERTREDDSASGKALEKTTKQ